MAVNDNHSSLHHAEVARRCAEGTLAECAEIGLSASARYYAGKAEEAAAGMSGGNPLRDKGDLIVGGANGVQTRLPIGQPGEAPVANIGPDGQIGLKYRPFNMPRMTFRADAGLKLYPGHEYVITPGDTNVVTLVAPEHLTSNDDCRIRIIYTGDASLTVKGGIFIVGGLYDAVDEFHMDRRCRAVEISCVYLPATWVVTDTEANLGIGPANIGDVLTQTDETTYGWKPLPAFALKSYVDENFAMHTSFGVPDGYTMSIGSRTYTFELKGWTTCVVGQLVGGDVTYYSPVIISTNPAGINNRIKETDAGVDTYRGHIETIVVNGRTYFVCAGSGMPVPPLTHLPSGFLGVNPSYRDQCRAAVIIDGQATLWSSWASYDGIGRLIHNTYAVNNLSNVAGNLDFVIDMAVNPDGSWFRKYRSGWLEQGGVTEATNYGEFHLVRPYAGAEYGVQVTVRTNTVGTPYSTDAGPLDSTRFYIHTGYLQGAKKFQWYACGQGA